MMSQQEILSGKSIGMVRWLFGIPFHLKRYR